MAKEFVKGKHYKKDICYNSIRTYDKDQLWINSALLPLHYR